ncbi:phage tail protein [Pedobacter sp. MW01-1-1]|uniref:phage tail protein n=1 Tax=Pedobacter sp. MW01-1-1 TaxID=3383027 RepID=UPI003FF0BC00
MEPFLGMISLFGFTFNPRGWATCSGQLLAISQNTALFSLLGTTYGGNGQNTFALPDLRGRAAIGVGQGPGLSTYTWGQVGGVENTTLTINHMPAHNHAAVIQSSTAPTFSDASVGNASTASGNRLANSPKIGSGPNAQTLNTYTTATAAPVSLNQTGGGSTGTIGITGGSQPFSIMQPYLALNYCIAMEGIFPSRN